MMLYSVRHWRLAANSKTAEQYSQSRMVALNERAVINRSSTVPYSFSRVLTRFADVLAMDRFLATAAVYPWHSAWPVAYR
jgi:hypothetical protein